MVDDDQDVLDRSLVEKVAKALMDRTEAGTAHWAETAHEGEYLATVGRQAFLVSRGGDRVELRTKGPSLEDEWAYCDTEESASANPQHEQAYRAVTQLHDLVDERLGHPSQERGNDRLRHSLELLAVA